MLVLNDKLVFKSNMTLDILKAIPHAKQFSLNGENLIAVKHGLEETLVLRNIGFRDVPHPIRMHYHWPGKFPPMGHQIDTAEFLVSYSRALCLNAPGTGKTLSALWGADYLMREGVIRRVLIVAPLSTLKMVWGKEIMANMPYRNFSIIVGTKKKRLDLLSAPGLEFAVINHDGLSTIYNDIEGFDLVIYDESTALKNPMSIRFRKFSRFIEHQNPRLWLLTGTPIAQNPVDVWALAKLVNSSTLDMSYSRFHEATMQKVSQFRWIPKPDAIQTCKHVLQPSIRFSLDECIDLPEMSYITKRCELTKIQQEAFDELREQACLTGHNISAANAAVLLSKMIQLCCGVVYTEDGQRVAFDDTNRFNALCEIIEEVSDKIIVYVPLRGVQDHLYKKLIEKKYDVAVVHGDVSKKDRDFIFTTFQNSDKIQILLAHPKVAAHGLTLTRANSVLWYAPIYSLDQYEQANARIKRIGTTGKTIAYHLTSTIFENELYRRLKDRKSILNDFLSLVRGVNKDEL